MPLLFNRPVRLVIILSILVNSILILCLTLLPFTDGPSHLAEAAIYKFGNNPAFPLGDYYTAVPWFYPNTFHTVFCSLFPSVEFGNKIFYILYVVGLYLSMYSVVRVLQGNQWYGSLAVLVVYGYNVTFGFSGYTIAIPTTLFLFWIILKDVQQEKLLYKVGAAFLLILLYLMHAQMALFGLVLYGASMLYRHWGNWLKMITNIALVSLPVIAVVIIWWMDRTAVAEEESTVSYLLKYYSKSYFTELWLRLRLPLFDNFALGAGITGLAIAAALFSLIFIPLFYFKAFRNIGRATLLRSNLTYVLIFLVISAGCYLLLPDKLPGQAPVYERFSTVVVLAIILFGSMLLKDNRSPLLRYFVLGTIVLYHGLWIEYFYAFEKENKDFRPALFSEVPSNAKLGGLIYDYTFRDRFPYMHFPNYYIVWNKGIATTNIIEYRFGVVRRGVKGDEIPLFNEWVGRKYATEEVYDSTLHYLLVKGKAPLQPDSNLLNFHLVKEAGKWQLYKNNTLKLQ